MRKQSISPLTNKALSLLQGMFNEEKAIFSFSSRLIDGQIINEYSKEGYIRYTINSFLGLVKADQIYDIDWQLKQKINRFLQLNKDKILNYGDKGLLLYLLSAIEHRSASSLLEELENFSNDEDQLLRLNLQEISWLLLGFVKSYEFLKEKNSSKHCHKLVKLILKYYWNCDSLFPYYSLDKWRKPYNSFGGIVYFLKSLYEYSNTFDDNYTRTIFIELSKRIISLQGYNGEWAWYYNVNKAKILDWYQIYSVHQDSMAILFLLPLLSLGVEEAEQASRKSYRWLFGNNELQMNLVSNNPFWIPRSIKKKGRFEREKRFVKSIMTSYLPYKTKQTNSSLLQVNTECRSYHIGWILYIWSGVKGFEEFTELQLLKNNYNL